MLNVIQYEKWYELAWYKIFGGLGIIFCLAIIIFFFYVKEIVVVSQINT